MTQRRVYQIEYPYFITFNTRDRCLFFDEINKAELLYKVIIKSCGKKIFLPLSFCILNNHIHLLINPPAQAAVPALGPNAATAGRVGGMADKFGYIISEGAHAIKSYYCHQLQKKYNIYYSPWQPRFNFRIVNTEKGLINTLNYIKYNYKKHNLPKKYSKYPYLYYDEDKINALFF